MGKSKRLQLYCYTHKVPDYGLVDDEIHTPIHVGKTLHKDVDVCPVGDDTGDNVSNLNGIMRELTGMYWVWKNVNNVKYVGSEHYRRRWGLSEDEIEKILKQKDIITFKPIDLGQVTLAQNYVFCHSFIDFLTIEYLVKRFYPDYAQSYDKYINQGHKLIPANCFICTKERYNDACEFVFDILFKFIDAFGLRDENRVFNHVCTFSQQACPPDKQRIGWDWIKYQTGITGFLAERLFTLYILHNFNGRIHEADIIEMEPTK